MSKRKRKFGVWLSNHTSRQDDEWLFVYAKDINEASKEIEGQYNNNRFSISRILPIKEFRRFYGNL